MSDSDLDSLIRIEKSRAGGSLSKKSVKDMVDIVRSYQKGTEAYHSPWRQWVDNYELLN